MPIADILGYAAGFITSLMLLPQVVKTGRERSTKDISLLMVIIATINEVTWISYGIVKNDWFIIAMNVIIFILVLVMMIFKIKYG